MTSDTKKSLIVPGTDASGYLAKFALGANGTNFRFDGKAEKFIRSIDDTEVPVGKKFAAVYEQTQAGWIQFVGDGTPPIRTQGAIFDGFIPPDREEMGELDRSLWDTYNGKPKDPIVFQILLPLLAMDDGELHIFNALNATSRRAADMVIAACQRMQRSDPDHYPVYALAISSYYNRDAKVDVAVPVFERVGVTPKIVPPPGNGGDGVPSDGLPF